MDISLFDKLLSIPKTIYSNMKVLPFFSAIKFPFFVYHKTKLVDLKGKWVIDAPLKRFMIKFGMYGAGTCLKDGSTIEIRGTIIFHGICALGGNCQLCVTKNGTLEIANHVTFTSECHLVCNKNISIGEDTIISWGTQIMDSDLHELIENGTRINEDKAVVIGRHCWICSNAVLHKGTELPDNTIIAQGAMINCTLDEPCCIYTGLPIRKLKSNVTWQ